MNWRNCDNCGRPKLTGLAVDGGNVFCNDDCREAYRAEARGGVPGPIAGRGTDSTIAQARREDRRLDRVVGGTVVPGSGSVAGLDGDRVVGDTQIEEKVRRGESYRFTTATWEKLLGEAERNGQRAAFILVFGRQRHRVLVMPLDEALERMGGSL